MKSSGKAHFRLPTKKGEANLIGFPFQLMDIDGLVNVGME